MITIVYYIELAEKEAEVEWLREQKIFPAIADHWDFAKGSPLLKVGVIVTPEAALAIKLRHKLQVQADYKQR